jgi:hypothetical protein
MGIVVARAAGVPSMLVENFTWDWIYEGYARKSGRMREHARYFRGIFETADYHVQTEPVCRPCDAELTAAPVSRPARMPVNETRALIGVPPDAAMVLVTMGGSEVEYDFPEDIVRQTGVYFTVLGVDPALRGTRGNLVLLPHHSGLYHPDLVNACDCVVGKVGYSTVAEVYHSGVPFGYTARPQFREAGPLVDYVEKNMEAVSISADDFAGGRWLDRVRHLLALPRVDRCGPNGADQVADLICSLLDFRAGNGLPSAGRPGGPRVATDRPRG